MRRFSLFLAVSAGLAFSACGDDKAPTTTDTTVQNDVAIADVATTDTTTPDTSVTPDTVAPWDVAVQADTTPPTDTTVEPPDLGEGTCAGMAACVEACTTEECESACLAAADSEAETAALTALNTCMTTNNCVPTSETPTDAEVKAGFACALEFCVDATVACFQGATVGTGLCPVLKGCVFRCEDNHACVRTCYETASTQSSGFHVRLAYCLDSVCHGFTGVGGEEACRLNAIDVGQPCSVENSQCGTGTIGAAPGAGAGGGE